MMQESGDSIFNARAQDVLAVQTYECTVAQVGKGCNKPI